MRRHFLFAEDERERSVGEGKVNLLRLWHNRRSAMLEGDESASGGEANAQVARELTLFWDLAKPMSSCTLSREGYIGVFARVAKALVLPLSTDPLAVPAAQRDWEYDLEGTGGIGESTKGTSSLDNELMTFEQFREAVMQLAEIILPVESAATLYVEFFRELRNSIAELVVSPSTSKPEQDENISAEPVDRFMLRPLNRVPKITKEAFLQKLPPSSDALRSIRGLQPPDQREMSLKQLLLSYNPRKFSLTRAFPKKKTNATANGNAAKTAEEQVKTESADVSTTVVEDSKVAAKRLHMELVGCIGSGATPVRGRKLHRETAAHWDPEEALTAALIESPALRVAVRAVDHKLRIRRRKVVTPPTEDEDSVGDTPPTTETTGTPEQGEKANNENADDDEEMDRAFRDEDFDALCAGNAIARSTALALLRLEATRSLLAGVGVVMDDVYPYELSTSENAEYTIATDYLVALTALPDELECQLVGSELTPTAGRLYSVRELALLKTTNPEELAARGFADFILPPKKMEVEAEELQETNDPAQSSDAGPKSEEEEIEEATPEDAENDDGAQVVPEEALPPPEPTPAERNEIEPPTESSLPFGSIALAKLAKGFREYVARMENELAMYRAATTTNKPSGYHLVAVLAVQSLNVIRDHCIQAITGTSLGLSRFSTSREAYAVSLPEDLNGSSRAEKVRWLLYGDWTALLEAESSSTTETFSMLPRRDAKRRLLSKWREFCPVTSSSNALTPGDPEYAACYSGRVYLLASSDARRGFCSYPLQFLRREIPVPSAYRNFWLVTTGVGETFTPAYLEALEAGFHVQTVSASKLLKTSPSISMEMRLMRGQVVSPSEAATAVAGAIKALLAKLNTSSGWMITDLPLTRDVAAVLLEHGCVPDAILLMDRESAAAQEEGGTNNDVVNALSALRREQFQVEKTGAEDISQGLGGAPRVITCPLFRQPSETLAAIERELNPLAPRLDSIEDGQAPQLVDEYDPAVIFVSPLPNQDDETSSLPQQDGLVEDDAGDPEAEAQIKAARSRALQLQGEFGRFCPVSWSTRGLLIPGLPSHVCCFRQQFYAFAGESERHAFERNPSVFIPTGPRATSNFTPCVFLLGVRGSGRGRIAAALAQTETEPGNIPSEFVNVDLVAASNEAERNQLQEELKPEEVRLAQEEIFIRALQRELYRHQRTPEKAVAQIIAGLGLEASRIPTTSTLETCFKLGLFPTLVIPLTMSEDDVVNALLSRWASNLPAPRRKLAFTRKREDDGDAEGNETPQDGDEEEEPPIDVEAAREEESTRLREQYTEDQKALEEAIAAFRARGVKVYKPVDATSAPRQTIKHVRRILNDFMAGREALFERCDISAGDAMQKMLASDFRGFSFWLGNQQNLEQFLASPEAFVGYSPGQIPAQRGDDPWPSQDEAESEAQSLVARTPVNASLVSLLTVADCDFPEMKGYCPVTFALGSGAKDWASLRHGSVFYRASYRSKVYFFVSEEARRKFCTEPSRYTSQSLPVKLPPQVTLAKSYPGQLEQQLGAALNEVLLALGSERPKFPQMSIRASACVYLALTLKALQRRYQLKVKPDPRSARDEDESDEEQKQRQERREEQAERDAVERRDAFVRDCRLGEQLKAAITPAYPSCGSGVKVARSMRAAQDSSGELQQIDTESGDREVSAVEEVELLRRRFDVIISGCDGDNTPLPTDPHSARMNARAAFIEYTKTSTPS
ncbi:hypothetical protein PF008_g6757 [Phytophthora fragariae]|uniref:Cilia- and flagella-associated protein 206 n=2 Tax=Phytophthora fragariae TaxID=53985 RepID=A0A6G0S4I0_9STRA|nr:hypothetical protein PF008_g6757 [Phytophthora fragariae]